MNKVLVLLLATIIQCFIFSCHNTNKEEEEIDIKEYTARTKRINLDMNQWIDSMQQVIIEDTTNYQNQ